MGLGSGSSEPIGWAARDGRHCYLDLRHSQNSEEPLDNLGAQLLFSLRRVGLALVVNLTGIDVAMKFACWSDAARTDNCVSSVTRVSLHFVGGLAMKTSVLVLFIPLLA